MHFVTQVSMQVSSPYEDRGNSHFSQVLFKRQWNLHIPTSSPWLRSLTKPDTRRAWWWIVPLSRWSYRTSGIRHICVDASMHTIKPLKIISMPVHIVLISLLRYQSTTPSSFSHHPRWLPTATCNVIHNHLSPCNTNENKIQMKYNKVQDK